MLMKVLFSILVVGSLPAYALSFGDSVPLRIKPSRNVTVMCFSHSGQPPAKEYQGTSDELTVMRVVAQDLAYEVYRDGFFVSSCDQVRIRE